MLQHVGTCLLPALEAIGVGGRVERGETGIEIRLQALSGTAETGLAMVELNYDVRTRESRFRIAATITLGALVDCMLRASAQSFDGIRVEVRSALERASLWRSDSGALPGGTNRPSGGFIGAIDPEGLAVLHSYEGGGALVPRAQQPDRGCNNDDLPIQRRSLVGR